MNSKQDDARLFERNGNLPEVLVKRQHDAGLRFSKVPKDIVLPSSAIGPYPKHIMAVGAKGLDDRLRKVLVSEEAHLRWDWIGFVFVGQVAGVRQAATPGYTRSMPASPAPRAAPLHQQAVEEITSLVEGLLGVSAVK
jgi:hypothetical protein